MTGPFRYHDYESELGVQSPIAEQEWRNFLKRRQELLGMMLNTARGIEAQQGGPGSTGMIPQAPIPTLPPVTVMAQPPRQTAPGAEGFGPGAAGELSALITGQPLSVGAQMRQGRQAHLDDLLGQARAWDVENPEQYDPGTLQQIIEMRRQEVPREEEESLLNSFGATAAIGTGFVAGAVGQTARLAGNILGLITKPFNAATEGLPAGAHSLNMILGMERSRQWLYDLSQNAAQVEELVRMGASEEDRLAADVAVAGGRITGYVWPGNVAWRLAGAAGALPRVAAWAMKASPFMRAVAQGTAAGAMLEAGSDETMGNKAFNIGLGSVIGGVQALGGMKAAAATLGVMGAGVGGQIGDTGEERTRNAVIGALGGAALPFAVRGIGAAFMRVKSDFPTPFDQRLGETVRGTARVEGPGIDTEYAPWEYASADPVGPPPLPRPSLMRGSVNELPSSGQVHTPPAPQVRAMEVTEGPGGVPQVRGTELPAPQGVRGYLPAQSVATPDHPAAYLEQQARILYDDAATMEREGIDANSLGDTPADLRMQALELTRRADLETQVARERDASRFRSPPVRSGPLAGSQVADRDGNPVVVYHGTGAAYEIPDFSLMDVDALFGPGLYTTQDPAVASTPGYTKSQWLNNFDALTTIQQAIDKGEAKLNSLDEAMRNTTDKAEIDSLTSEIATVIDNLAWHRGRYRALAESAENPTTLPNVKPMRLDIRNPFDVDQKYTIDEAEAFILRAKQALPDYDFDNAVGNQLALAQDGTISGEDLYLALTNATKKPGDTQAVLDDLVNHQYGTPNYGLGPLGKEGVNRQLLPALGYDGITHIGGARMGDREHRVWIAFKPEQIHLPWDVPGLSQADAEATALGITKQQTLMDSDDLPRVQNSVKLTDADIVGELVKQNPAGVSVLKGVGDPLSILQASVRDNETGRLYVGRGHFAAYSQMQSEGLPVNEIPRVGQEGTARFDVGFTSPQRPFMDRMEVIDELGLGDDQPVGSEDFYGREDIATLRGEQDVIFVEREGRLDALVGPVTEKQVNQYRQYGVFEGQRIISAKSGVEGTITKVSDGTVLMARESGGPPIKLAMRNVMPSKFAAPQREVPELWNSFKAYALGSLDAEVQAAGMAPIQNFTDTRVIYMMQSKMLEYFDLMGFSEGEQQVLGETFNKRWVEELRDLDPESRDFQREMVDEATVLENALVGTSDDLPVSLEEVAERKGFIWLTNPGEGGTLIDAANPGPSDMPMETDEAARTFLVNVDRNLPDLTPISEIPMEVAEMLPVNTMREPILPHESEVESVEMALSILQRDGDGSSLIPPETLAGGGGDFPPPPPPPPGEDFVPWYPDDPRLGPGDNPSLGAAFRRLERKDPSTVARLVHEFMGLLTSQLRYTRYGMLKLEKMLTNVGLDMGKAWQHYEELATGRTKAFNEGFHWINRAGQITRKFPRELMRDGTITRIHEIEDYNARMTAFWRLKDRGFSDARIQKIIAADEEVTNFFRDWFTYLNGDDAFSLSLEREIFRYIPHVRSAMERGMRNPWDADFLSPEVSFFAEHVRDGRIQMRVMDIRDLMRHVVNAAMFKKHQSAPWEQFVSTWQNDHIPQPIREYMMDYATLSRFGYDPRGEIAVRAVQKVVGKVIRAPISTAEAQRFLNMPAAGMYMAMLGGKTAIFFRDAIQPILGLAKVRADHMAGVYGDIVTSWRRGTKTKLHDMLQRGYDGGWIERENPNLEGAGMFEDSMLGGDEALANLTPRQELIREMGARIGDQISRLPTWLSSPSESKINTLFWYGKLGQLNRLIVGEAAHRQATQGLAEYRKSILAAALNRDPSRAIPYEKFADDHFFSSFERPIARRLRELVDGGQDEEAANLFAREVANWSQFRYGRKEMPPATRGNIGRMAFMFGNFSGQFAEGMVSGLANGTARHRARYASIIGGTSALMWGLKQATGWDFDKWSFGSAFEYAGSPFIRLAATGALAAQGVVNHWADRPVSNLEQNAVRDLLAGRAMKASDFFPYQGYINSANEYYAAARGTDPLAQSTRFGVMGTRGTGPSIANTPLRAWWTGEDVDPRYRAAPPDSMSPNGGGPASFGYPQQGFGYPPPAGPSNPGAGGFQ